MQHLNVDLFPLVPGSPGERFHLDLMRRAVADGEAEREPQSDHPMYGALHRSAVILAGIESGRYIMAAQIVRESETGACVGIVGLHGAGSTSENAEFINVEHLRFALNNGARIINEAVEDISHEAHRLH
jgi:hypothetical protein